MSQVFNAFVGGVSQVAAHFYPSLSQAGTSHASQPPLQFKPFPAPASPLVRYAGAGGGHDCHRRGSREDHGAERKFEEAAIAIAVEGPRRDPYPEGTRGTVKYDASLVFTVSYRNDLLLPDTV